MKGALAGALGIAPGVDDTLEPDSAVTTDDDLAEPNELELAAAEEFQKATKSGTAADIVRAFRGLKSACEASYGEDDEV